MKKHVLTSLSQRTEKDSAGLGQGRLRTAWMDYIKTWTGLSVEESIRMTEDRDKWRKYVTSMVWPTVGSRTAKEQNRTVATVETGSHQRCVVRCLRCRDNKCRNTSADICSPSMNWSRDPDPRNEAIPPLHRTLSAVPVTSPGRIHAASTISPATLLSRKTKHHPANAAPTHCV